ncbi:unnamed protein product [Rhizophagus irregularis]|nr:unnamed protein product [Rhizophagus irregularis]
MDISNQNLDTTEITIRNNSKTDAKNLWKKWEDDDEYQKKEKNYTGICGEYNEPGTGLYWCQPCNAKRFKENFKNWTSENKNIDELIQQSQLNAFFASKCLECIFF